MVDPRREAILIWSKGPQGVCEDKTSEVLAYRRDAGVTYVTFKGGSKEYSYSRARVAVVRNLELVPLGHDVRVEVRGKVWPSVPETYRFQVRGDVWWRLFFRRADGEEICTTYRDADVRFVEDAARRPQASKILHYWRSLVAGLSADDPLRQAYDALDFVHPESALARYLNAEPIVAREPDAPLIFPFFCNLSQREAVENALRYPVSVIEGPPGTGKTQTILNLIANIINSSESIVGIVSFNNSAVDNVREKLVREGFGYIVAGLGREEKRRQFFAEQSKRNEDVERLVLKPIIARPPAEQISDIDRTLRRWQEDERQLAQTREELDAYRLERRHFARYFEQQNLPELEKVPLLRKSAEHILDYLAETEISKGSGGSVRRLVRRIRGYFKYGPTRHIDADDTYVVLQLQCAYYDRKIDELERQITQQEAVLQRADFTARTAEYRQLSIQALEAGLWQRYADMDRVEYAPETFRREFGKFVRDYPVILSTCHSIRRSLANGFLLDYVIIDEASQVDLLAASLALACARSVVIVGDQHQIQHIADEAACSLADTAPMEVYDYRQQNILSSLLLLYGEDMPKAMLREHYRCDPAIIGFCNKKFYDGQLIPFTRADLVAQPLALVRTAEGNHMRQHRGGGRTNQREIDVILEEVLPEHCRDFPQEEVGITTPYRRQADKVADALIDHVQADTVHKFQGREKQAIVMTTVLDETWRGRAGIKFVDDPRIVNVAVSRATKKFVLVTNHDMLSKSRHLRDLVGYIQYQNPDQGLTESKIVSVFDLLYRDYSARLLPLAGRLKGELKYKSEDIVWTVLNDIFSEPAYSDLYAVSQVLLHSLIADPAALTDEQVRYVLNRASVDIVVYSRITNQLMQVIEVDGFAYHENDPIQLGRDALKNAICETCEIPLLRLPTTGSGEERLIREALDRQLNVNGSVR